MASRYALFLRGINVGTKNSLPMATFRQLLGDIGCRNVETYVQSGNAVFESTLGTPQLLSKAGKVLETEMKRPIPLAVRTLEEMEAIVKANPFRAHLSEPSKLCVTFLEERPIPAELAKLRGADFGPDEFRLAGREIYSWHPNGQGKSELAKALTKLPVPVATTRNWNTVLAVMEMLQAS
ncbi:MAG: DUF1697 domain-containing protein [Myxococcaceae bacterium]